MPLFRQNVRWCLLACIGILVGGCAETEFIAHGAKELTGSARESSGNGHYKVGSPYAIAGVWYYPRVDFAYKETGIASWYGDEFHGRPTANGETFDMNRISAAHRTLPLPSAVRVTNLDNGRSLVVRVNDRGPFAHGRIIDLSRRAAQLLGFERQGTAKVRVEILAEDSRQLAAAMGVTLEDDRRQEPPAPSAAPRTAVMSRSLASPPGTTAAPPPTAVREEKPVPTTAAPPGAVARAAKPALDGTVTVVPVEPNQEMFVQAGAFTRFDNANRVRAYLSTVGRAEIRQVQVEEKPYFRVRLGPIASVDEADRVLESVVRAGYTDARIVID